MDLETDNQDVNDGAENIQIEPFDKDAFMGIKVDPIKQDAPVDTTKVTDPKVIDKNNPPQAPPPATELDYAFKHLKEELGEGYQVPEIIVKGLNDKGEKLSEKEKYEILVGEIQKHTDNGIGDDEFIKEYVTAKNDPTFDFGKFIEHHNREANILGLPADDFLILAYTKHSEDNKLNWSQDDIKAHIESLTPIQKSTEESRLKNQVKENIKLQKEQSYNQRLMQFKEAFEQEETANQKIVTDFIEKNKESKAFFGIPFSEAEKKEFFEDLPKLSARDLKTMKNTWDQLLQSDEDFIRLTPLLWKYLKNDLDSSGSKIKEELKKDLENRLSPSPNIKTSRSAKNPDEFDRATFMYGKNKK